MSLRLTLRQPLMLTPAVFLSLRPGGFYAVSMSSCLPVFSSSVSPEAETPLTSPKKTPQLPVPGTKTAAGSGASASLPQLPVAVLFPQLVPFITPLHRGRGDSSVGGVLAWQARDMSSLPGTHTV